MKPFSLKQIGKCLLPVLLLILVNNVHAQTGTGIVLKKLLDGAQSQLVKDSAVTVQDSAYFKPLSLNRLDTPYPVRNIITFKINEYSSLFLPATFTATARVRITYTLNGEVDSTDQDLTINYDTANTYAMRTSFVFKNAHKVKVQVLSITTEAATNVVPALMLENAMELQPAYQWSCTENAIQKIESNNPNKTDSTDEIMVRWDAVTGADVYDLEWAYIDSSALNMNRYGNPVNPALVFAYNTTRVTIAGNSYRIPLLYDDGGILYYRVRAVQEKGNYKRIETVWSSDFSQGLGAYSFCGHQRQFNWQSSVAYAEDGKRKVTVQYYDGSLRSRQTVTKDNTTDTTIIAETAYDYQGRPVIQVLPVPTLSNVIKYTRNFNQGINGVEYDKEHYDHIDREEDILTASAAPMDTTTGANGYYSGANPNKNNGFNKYIPNAEGYAFTETEYTSDNTGRISRQSGVGPTFKLGSGHETKYFYGTPAQEDLYALFGTEVGDVSHYFRNMVADANGQYAVTYQDMHGRTIATALLGSPENTSLADLPNKEVLTVTDTLSGPSSNFIKDMDIESHISRTIGQDSIYHFKYVLPAPVLKKANCEGDTVSYTGLYDLQIKITDNVRNQHLPDGKPFIVTDSNYVIKEVKPNTPPDSLKVEFSVFLPKGSYEITRTLSVNQKAMEIYRDSFFLASNLCTSLEEEIGKEVVKQRTVQCYPDCETCKANLADWDAYRVTFALTAGADIKDTALYRNQALVAYQDELTACKALCNETTENDGNRTAMLLDMTPPNGQYANPQDSAYKYSIFYQSSSNATAIYGRNDIVYLDDTGEPDMAYDEVSGQMVKPQQLSARQFADQFKPSWAQALLKYHPEYCKLLQMQQYDASYLYDKRMQKADSYAEAKAAGFLNPLGDPTAGFPVNTIDPISQYPNLVTQLKTKMNRYVVSDDTNPKAVFSIWSFATISIKCGKDGAQGCAANYGTNAAAFDEERLCDGDRDMAWRAFRQAYLDTKRSVLEGVIPKGCASEGDLIADKKTPRFATVNGAFGQNGLSTAVPKAPETAIAQSQQDLQKLIADNCQAYVQYWIHQLGACYDTTIVKEELVPTLLQVCKEGGDLDHIRGASTVRPASSMYYRSFEQVLEEYNQSHSHNTDPYICNTQLLAIPAAYDKQTAYTDNTTYAKPSDCECSNLGNIHREYLALKQAADSTFSAYLFRTRKVQLDQANLDALLDACSAGAGSCSWLSKPLTIPALIQCNVGPACATCTDVNTVYNAFKAKYPNVEPVIGDVDSVQQLKNELFASYMNNHLGFSKSAWEYKTFMDSCLNVPVGPGATVCKPADPNAKTYSYDNGGTDNITDIHRTADNGYILAGSTTGCSNGGKDGYVIKTDSRGEVIWSKTYGAEQDDEFTRLVPTVDGGYAAIGSTYSYCYEQGAMMIVKLDASGTVLWNKVIDLPGYGVKGSDIIQTRDNDLAFGGLRTTNSVGDGWVFGALSPDGNDLRWMNLIRGSGERKGVNIMENINSYTARDNSILSVTSSIKAAADYDAILLEFDTKTGTRHMTSIFDIGGQDNFSTGIISGVNTRFTIGMTIENAPGTASGSGYIAYLDYEYNMMNRNQLNLPGTLMPQTLTAARTSDGGAWLSQTMANPLQDVYWHRLDNENNILSSNHVKITASEQLRRIFVNPDGTLAGAGMYNNKNALLMLATANGKTGCADSSLNIPNNDVSYQVPFNIYLGEDSVLTSNCISILPIGEIVCHPVKTLLTCPPSDSCYTIYDGPLLCGNAEAVFPTVDVNSTSACSDSTFFAVSAGTVRYNYLADSVRNDFDDSYRAAMLKAADKEQFTVTYSSSEYQYTLYYYDQAGNLVKTIPPAGVVKDRSAEWINNVKAAKAAGTILVPEHRLATEYRYNTLNQVVAQKSPDGGESHFWYDRLGRLAVSQNAKQAATHAYSYTIYDQLGRITEVGEITSGEAMTDATSRTEESLADWVNDAARQKTQITRTVYDLPDETLAEFKVLDARNLRNRVAWTATYPIGDSLLTNGYDNGTFYSYDIHGNVDTLLQDYKYSVMADAHNRWKKVSYNYDLISGKVNQVNYQAGKPDAFYHRYSYDAENRITNVETSHDSIYWENDAFYQYYKHGPLARSVIGQQQVQGLDYAYTLQGWIKGVNGTALTADQDMGGDGADGGITARDAFSYSLHYFGDNEYKSINGNVQPFASATAAGSGFKPLYNGNIGAMSVNLPKVGEPLFYAYGYDALNRIVRMDAVKGFNTTTNTWTPVAVPDFGERVSYDPNGNILGYNRKGNSTWANKPENMDNLTYHYIPGTNQLDHIQDTVHHDNYDNDIDDQLAGNYKYDAIGNLVSDDSANITHIDWTVYGKISRISKRDNSTITYTYDAAGNRISKKVGNVTTWYVRDATGNVMSVYTHGDNTVRNGALSQTEVDLYGSSRLGISTRVTNVDTADVEGIPLEAQDTARITTFIRDNKFFELGNHLGNVLATVSDTKQEVAGDGNTVDHYEADVASANDYYPFGMQEPGRSWNAGKYRYGFNGQERNDDIKGEGNSYTAAFWEYDPRIGRRWNVDPVVKPHESPFATYANNPILIVDPDGRDSVLYSWKFGNKYNALTKKGGDKRNPIFIVDEDKPGFNAKNPWATAEQLKYVVGSDVKDPNTKKGISGLNLRSDHPLRYNSKTKTGGTLAGEPVYESDLYDMTSFFDGVLKKYETHFTPMVGMPDQSWPAQYWFAKDVTDDGPFDLKSRKRENLGELPSFAAVEIGEWTLWRGRLTRYDDYGNISYGYWGRINGFRPAFLLKKADDNQDTKNGKTTHGKGDEPRDKQSIIMGIRLYNKEYQH